MKLRLRQVLRIRSSHVNDSFSTSRIVYLDHFTTPGWFLREARRWTLTVLTRNDLSVSEVIWMKNNVLVYSDFASLFRELNRHTPLDSFKVVR